MAAILSWLGAMLEIGVGGYADPQYLLEAPGVLDSQTEVRIELMIFSLANGRQRIVKTLSDMTSGC